MLEYGYYDTENKGTMAQSKRYTGSRSIYTTVSVYGFMDVDDIMICCGVEREEIYMGGGLWVYKCHACGSKMETNIK